LWEASVELPKTILTRLVSLCHTELRRRVSVAWCQSSIYRHGQVCIL